MSLMLTARPVRAIVALMLIVVLLLAGCQGITTIPQSPVAEAPTSSAEPLPATTTTEATASAQPPAKTPQPSNTPADGTPESSPDPSAPASASTPETVTDAGLATIESLSENLMPRRDQVELAFQFGRTQSLERVARTEPLDVEVGDKEVFNVTNVATNRNYTITATLVLILDHVLVYVEDGVELNLQDLEQSAREFNDKIYPRNRELFGSEWSPGVDGDPRLTILNARIEGAGGYFSGSDEVPKSVNRFSNEREMFYINTDDRVPGTSSYGDVLAHEFQHMIQWNESERPTTWTNEGLAQLAEELNGFEESVISVTPAYLVNPDLQLTDWADSPQDAIAHYGASYLFLTYFYEQYGKDLDLKTLIREGAGERLELFAETARKINPDIQDFGDLYADWSIANLINNRRYGQGRYAYRQLPETVQPEPLPNNGEEVTVAQFGSDFYEIPEAEEERVLRFDGSDTIGVVATEPEGNAMWWSNRGDSGHSTITRTLDLRNVSNATLQFRLWYDIEADYDYGFVAVSTDGGKTYTTLQGRHTTTEDPQGANWGNGYTGVSGGDVAEWVDEQLDLTPYVGNEIILRFSLVTDDAFNRPGMAIDNIRVPEINFSDDAESDGAGWSAAGFTRTNNRLPQQWEVRLVRISGRTVTFEPLQLDAQGRGEYRLGPNERGALVVMATTPHTTERASYTISITNP